MIASGADVAGIGGFSGRESQVTVSWLAQPVRSGKIRFVLATGGSNAPADGRVGASAVMSRVQQACRSTSVGGLYDCRATALG